MKQHRESLPFWQQLNSVFSCSHSNGTSTMIYLCLSYHSILAPDRVTLAVPIPLTVPLNRVHCPKRFIPLPCRMVGRILETELQVALQLISQNSEKKNCLQHILMQHHVAMTRPDYKALNIRRQHRHSRRVR